MVRRPWTADTTTYSKAHVNTRRHWLTACSVMKVSKFPNTSFKLTLNLLCIYKSLRRCAVVISSRFELYFVWCCEGRNLFVWTEKKNVILSWLLHSALFANLVKSIVYSTFRACNPTWKAIKNLPTSPTAHGVAAVYNTFKLNHHEKLIGLDASSFSFVLPSFFLRPSFALPSL